MKRLVYVDKEKVEAAQTKLEEDMRKDPAGQEILKEQKKHLKESESMAEEKRKERGES